MQADEFYLIYRRGRFTPRNTVERSASAQEESQQNRRAAADDHQHCHTQQELARLYDLVLLALRMRVRSAE